MMRSTFILIGTVAVLVNVIHCKNENAVSVERIYDFAQNILNATEKWRHELKEYSIDGRKSKLLPLGLLPFHALWGFGGFHALAILFAIKFKIIIIAAIVAASVYYYTKLVAAKKCAAGEHHHDTVTYPTTSTYTGGSYYHSPLTAYSSPYADDITYTGYHDPTLHSAIPSYAFDHDHHLHHFDHATDYGRYLPDHTHLPGMMTDGTVSKDSDMSGGSGGDGGGGAAAAAMSSTYRRIGRNRRRRANKRQPFDFIDIGELAFQFLGVNTDGCRRRFVCELDFRAQTNPITRLAFTFIGRNFFERYRISGENSAKLQKFTDCAKIFNDCKDAEKYNNIEDDKDENDVKTEVELKNNEGVQTNRQETKEITEKNIDNDTSSMLKTKGRMLAWR